MEQICKYQHAVITKSDQIIESIHDNKIDFDFRTPPVFHHDKLVWVNHESLYRHQMPKVHVNESTSVNIDITTEIAEDSLSGDNISKDLSSAFLFNSVHIHTDTANNTNQLDYSYQFTPTMQPPLMLPSGSYESITLPQNMAITPAHSPISKKMKTKSVQITPFFAHLECPQIMPSTDDDFKLDEDYKLNQELDKAIHGNMCFNECTASQNRICWVSSDGFLLGTHEWIIEIIDADTKFCDIEVGVVGVCNLNNITIDDGGIKDTAELGARAVFGNFASSDSAYYASYNADDKERCFKDLSKTTNRLSVGDAIKISLDLVKFRIKFFVNDAKVRKPLSLQANKIYFPCISFIGNCQFGVIQLSN